MFESRQKIETALSSSLIFGLLGNTEREHFISTAISQSWTAGQQIFSMGDTGTSMILVKRGEVRISRPSANGRSIILTDLQPGSVFGEIALLDGGVRSADAIAITNCSLLVFNRREIIRLLRDNWPLAESLLNLLCSRLRSADERIEELALSDIRSRLAKQLIARAHSGPNGGPLRVSDTQGGLAAIVGCTRETINRSLRAWEKAGLVSLSGGRISLLDPVGLTRVTM
jgi:CRP/FNR family transcriptional regulator, cyclic AMP receptor protein